MKSWLSSYSSNIFSWLLIILYEFNRFGTFVWESREIETLLKKTERGFQPQTHAPGAQWKTFLWLETVNQRILTIVKVAISEKASSILPHHYKKKQNWGPSAIFA